MLFSIACVCVCCARAGLTVLSKWGGRADVRSNRVRTWVQDGKHCYSSRTRLFGPVLAHNGDQRRLWKVGLERLDEHSDLRVGGARGGEQDDGGWRRSREEMNRVDVRGRVGCEVRDPHRRRVRVEGDDAELATLTARGQDRDDPARILIGCQWPRRQWPCRH